MTRVTVRVVPNAKRAGVSRDADGTWRLRIDAPAVDGKANKRAVQVLAREVFGVSRSAVVLVNGEKSRVKTFEVDLAESEVLRLLAQAAGED